MDKKALPSVITGARIALSPIFFCLFVYLPEGGGRIAALAGLWTLFAAIELSDLFDGMAARKLGATSDFGKVFDPFADSFARLTYFAAFLASGSMPALAFLAVLYRDLAVGFIRLIMAKRGVSMPARLSGKIKAWVYALAGFLGLARKTLEAFPGIQEGVKDGVSAAALASFWLCAAVAVWTMADYLLAARPSAGGRGRN
jgi:CDP-diacylglycerol--glycerol-3-phosphate 3-phosphatidyltransferase